jgi:hypothetical protein
MQSLVFEKSRRVFLAPAFGPGECFFSYLPLVQVSDAMELKSKHYNCQVLSL